MLRWALEAKSEQVQIIVPRHEVPGRGVFFFKVWMSIEFLGYENGLVFDFCLGFVTNLFYSIIYTLYYVMLCYICIPSSFQTSVPSGKKQSNDGSFFRVIFSNTCEGCCFCTSWIPENPVCPYISHEFLQDANRGEYLLKSNFEGKVRYFCFSNCCQIGQGASKIPICLLGTKISTPSQHF